MVFVGRPSDRSGERFLHAALPLLSAALGLIAVAPLSTTAPLLAFAALALAAAGIYSFYPPFWPIPQRMMAGESRAMAIGLINSVGNLGGFFGPYIVGYINTVAKSSYAELAFLAGATAAVPTVDVNAPEDIHGGDLQLKTLPFRAKRGRFTYMN